MGNDPPNPTEGNIINKQQEADPGSARKVSEPTKIETSRKRSWVWDFFTEVTTANGKRRATCDFCSKSYAADPKQNGTTSLGNHLVNVCLSSENPFREKEIELEKGQTTLNFEPLKPEYFRSAPAAVPLLLPSKKSHENMVVLVFLLIILNV
ncbi:uncharacterized protein LOC120015471 [Tripterygium wilfordii]|uniref:uncharacterized protein LOC120015471 n=1 Tax=Tripterygium wilfordii TaxID=458696 RepID=UPI0018F855C3|nr:uncharacterized protein LOC120015471 [Tripterygium wilfordii]XP_038723848.1 uncharacterized protein LOC120015471 [Tripterygium wilfordii]